MKKLIKESINKTLSALFNVKLESTAVRGRNIFEDIKRLGLQPEVVFDVGANRGQWSLELLNHLQAAKIYCFEPVEGEYNILLEHAAKHENIEAHQLALSDFVGDSIIWLGNNNTNSSLIKTNKDQTHQAIHCTTIEEFCRIKAIQHICLLKIDTEGYELQVLKGAESLLSSHQIDLVFAEVGLHSKYVKLVLFDEIRRAMEAHNYYLFGIYDQQVSWDGKPYVAYANACFISGTLADR